MSATASAAVAPGSVRPLATAGGFLALLLWSASLTVSRSISEALGPTIAAATVFLTAGTVSALFGGIGLPTVRAAPWRVATLGVLFTTCVCAFYVAVAGARDPAQVIAVGLFNYFWPVLTVVGSLVVLRAKAHPLLALGVVLALGGGVALAGPVAMQGLSAWPCLVAFGGACAWATYSLLARRWFAGKPTGTVPLYLLTAGAAMSIASVLGERSPEWSPRVLALLAWQSLLPGVAAYTLWEVAMRRGDAMTVAAGSCLAPVASTLIAAAWFHTVPDGRVWIACAAIALGSFVCWKTVREDQPA
jgi:drug/metabolite transporter (DMT)-like permease